jgi:SAM-dependent methyltransferase
VGRRGYALLSAISDPDDWADIINSIAAEIAVAGPSLSCRRHVVDVGAGSGHTALRISQRLLNTHRIECELCLVEPDGEARHAIQLLFSEFPGIGGAQITDDLKWRGSSTAIDAALFVHSSYYIEDLREIVASVGRKLALGGRLIFVAMSQESPFFMGYGRMGHKNVAEDIHAVLLEAGYETRAVPLVSRVTIPPDLWNSPESIESWMGLFPEPRLDIDWHAKLMEYITDGTDLSDRLIVGKRNERAEDER